MESTTPFALVFERWTEGCFKSAVSKERLAELNAKLAVCCDGLGEFALEHKSDAARNSLSPLPVWANRNFLCFGTGKGVITKGIFSLEKSLESLKSLDSLESLENGRVLLYFPHSGDSLKSLNSLESLENGHF